MRSARIDNNFSIIISFIYACIDIVTVNCMEFKSFFALDKFYF